MSEVSSKSMSQKDGMQVLKSAFNDNDMTISTSGFLDGKIGHRLKTKTVSATIDENLFFDEVHIETASFTNSSAIVTVSNTINFKVGQYLLLDVGTAGIPDDTTILSIDSSTQITMSASFTGSTGNETLHVANLIKRLRLQYNNAGHDILLDAARIS